MYRRIRMPDPERPGLLREGLDKSVPRGLRVARSDPAHEELIMYFEGEYFGGSQAVPLILDSAWSSAVWRGPPCVWEF